MQQADIKAFEEANRLIQHDKVRSLAILNRLVDAYPDVALVRFFRAATLSIQQDYRGAVDDLEVASQIEDSYLIQFNLGYCYRQTGDYAQALDCLRRSLDLSEGRYVESQLLLANTLHLLGRLDDAREALQKIGADQPLSPLAIYYKYLIDLDESCDQLSLDLATHYQHQLCRDGDTIDRVVLFAMKHDFHGFERLDDKADLVRVIQQAAQVGADVLSHCFPDSFVLPHQRNELDKALADRKHDWWIDKPSNLSGGQGIRITRDPMDIASDTDKDTSQESIVQRYVSLPFLVDNRKTNLRLMLAFRRLSPPQAFLWASGLVFISPNQYVHPEQEPVSTSSHIVNLLLANAQMIAQPIGPFGGHIVSLEEFVGSTLFTIEQRSMIQNNLMHLAHAVVEAIEAVGIFRDQVAAGGRFAFPPRFLGLDVLIDENLKPWLLEIERYPGLGGVTPRSKAINTRFRRDWMGLLFEENPNGNENFLPLTAK